MPKRVLMASIRYRMKSRQLRKLYIKYLQFCIRHSRDGAAVLGTRLWRDAGSRKCLVPKAELPWEVEGLFQVAFWESGRCQEEKWERMEPQFGEEMLSGHGRS